MNRLIFLSAAALPVLVDASLKSAALVVLAGLCALAMHRASAAARHVVWLVALLALLLVPVLSVVLPSWQVLPQWAAVERAKVTGPSLLEAPAPEVQTTGRGDLPEGDISAPAIPALPPSPAIPSTSPQQSTPPLPAPVSTANPPLPSAPTAWLVVAWAAGCSVLLLRLVAAHFLLIRATNRCPAAPAGLSAALTAAMDETGLKQPVRLLLDRGRPIPLVWGIFRPCLLLPAESVTWDAAQLRSVLLHETAHLRRRDPLVQCLMQLACALYWFNPLVWLAAWRLHVERERACDDLVLAKGVKPSVYAGHLLEIASQLTPTPWTAGCGLAMARKSSLEGRLLAVLSDRLDRRNVTRTLVAAAFLLGTGIAVPVAMLRAADEAWTSPKGAHIGSNDFSAFCVHDGQEAEFVIAYHGDFDSTSRSSSNAKSRAWTDDVTLTVKKPGIALSLHRLHTSPGKLSLTTAPAEARDLSKPAPSPRDFGQKEYDLAKGRVFLLADNGTVRQLDLPTPVVTDQESARKLSALIAAIPPQVREDTAFARKLAGKLASETIAKLKWGKPVNGLRMALGFPPALNDALLGAEPYFQLVVQNVSENAIHFATGDDAPNPRSMHWREGERMVQALSDEGAHKADWNLAPGECGVLRMFTKEEPGEDGKTISSLLEGDLAGGPRYHVVCIMEVAKAAAGAWTGKLVTGETRGSADKAGAPAPKHKDARALYEIWQRHARLSGDIPGALIGELAAAVKVFIGYNPTWETVPKLNEILPRLDATHDWKPADAIALLDELAAVQDSPLQTAAEKMTAAMIRQGETLPEKFAGVAWGETQPNGLRAAWVLEPRAAEHRMGTALKARLLVQNTGTIPVMTRVPTWHQGAVSARDAGGAEVEVSGIDWTTRAMLVPVRLGPGEFIEINTPGVGLGKDAGRGPWAGPRVGSNVLAKSGVELTLTHGPLALDGSGVGMREDAPHLIGPGWWQAHIKTRLDRELPLPAAAERTRLLDRAMRELFAKTPTADEIAAFATDQTDGAFDALVQRLAARADVVEFSASLPAAPVRFLVLPADPAADKMPRVVLGPGEYPLSAGTAEYGAVTLKIIGRSVGDRRTNDAQLLFEPTEFTGKLPPDPHQLEIPDGWGTWAIVCSPGEGFFYLLHQGGVRKIDYTKPREVTDTSATDLPAGFRDEVKRQLDIAGVSAAQQAEVFEKPEPPAATPAPETSAVEPKNEHARAHFALWQKYARANGDIPGGLVALLGKSILAGNEPKFPDLQRRCDGTRDWPAQEAADFLDALAATDNWSDDDGRLITIEHGDIAQHGKPLPPELASLPWGTADDSMVPISKSPTWLRAAFTLDPTAASYAQGTRLPVTIHYHNSGTAPVVFPIGLRSVDLAEARDEQGRNIFTSWVFPDGDNGRMKDGPWKAKHSVRLEPGHWISISGAQLTIPEGHYPFAKDAHGIVVMATPDSTVKLKWCAMTSTWRESQKGEVEWKERVQQSVARFSPMPKSRADREGLIRRVTFALFGEEPTAADIAAFAADDSPEALAKLTARLQSLPPPVRYGGWLKTGEQTFKITPAPADYRGTVMSAKGPGLYEVAPSLYMHHGGAQVDFTYVPALDPPHPQLTFAVKDQENLMVPHGIVWRHGSRTVWVAEKERVRKLDLTVPGKLMETELPAGLASIPDDLRAELVKTFPAIETAAPPAQESSRSDKSRLLPQHEDAQALFKIWQAGARTDGKIPGGLIGQLARTTDDAAKQITDANISAKLAALRPRLDASRDWTQAEAVALLDDITAISTVPVSWADTAMRFPRMRMVRAGEPLPAELQSAAWGKPAANGLRAAWLLEPRAEQYALGTVLKARVLFHNSGTTPVVFETETWHQSDDHSARDAKGVEIPVNATWFTGITPMSKFRLAPGEFCEVMGHGIAIGAGEYADERSTGTVGAIIEAKEGDVLTLSHSVDAGTGGWTRPDDHWLVTIAGRVANEAPMPASAADREQLIRRVTLDILGVAPTAEEISAFTADETPDALATLTARLQATPRVEPFIGKLPTGETKFRVLPADPNAATAPRSATAPGRYVLGDGVHLQVRQITENGQRRNSAEILFFGPDPTKQAPHKPHEISLPDGLASYAFAWVRGAGKLWLVTKGVVRSYDFTNPAQVRETRHEPGSITKLPEHLREALKESALLLR
jgi:beta-lactamase regulating signal transducer with metallopeptidase domain